MRKLSTLALFLLSLNVFSAQVDTSCPAMDELVGSFGSNSALVADEEKKSGAVSK